MRFRTAVSAGVCRLLVGAAFTVFSAVASAGGIAQLKQFVVEAREVQGEFEQTVIASSGRRPQLASGSFAFSRPGKFRWTYEKPYAQVLVSDGTQLWAWDPDLNQVTVRHLGDALGSTPAAILAGEGALERDFELAEDGASDGLDWVLAVPRQPESLFQSMRLGLSGGMLRRMEMVDGFGQQTLIVLTALRSGVPVDPALYRFIPPPGADILGE